MGEYYNWINIDRKEYIDPVDFDFGSKFHESGQIKGELIRALHELLANEWHNCHIAWIGDECSIPKDNNLDFFNIIKSQMIEANYRGSWIYDFELENYRNVSSLFKNSEEEVRNEIKYYLEQPKGYGYPDTYGIKAKEDPYEGLFKKDGMDIEYIINYSKKICFSYKKTKILNLNGEINDFYSPLPILLGYGRYTEEIPGLWLGDLIGASNQIDDSIKILDEIYLDW